MGNVSQHIVYFISYYQLVCFKKTVVEMIEIQTTEMLDEIAFSNSASEYSNHITPNNIALLVVVH